MPQLLVVGDWQRSEMSPIRRWFSALGSRADVRQSDHLPDDDPLGAPDLVIVCQSWPDEFLPSAVSAALGRWPLALWVCCYGAWCDSDGRNRSTWPIGVRVPVAESERRLNHIWQVLTEQQDDPLPLTASRDEAFEFDHCDGRARPGNVDGDQPITRLNVVEKTNGF